MKPSKSIFQKDDTNIEHQEIAITRQKRKNIILDNDEDLIEHSKAISDSPVKSILPIKSTLDSEIFNSDNSSQEIKNDPLDDMSLSEEEHFSNLGYPDNEVLEDADDYEESLENRMEFQARKLSSSSRFESSHLASIAILQPGSTPITGRRRFLAWNSIGWISVLLNEDSDDVGTIDIGFNDHSFMKPIHFVDYIGYQLGCLSKKGAFFASKYKPANPVAEEQPKPSSLYYLPFASWAPKSEWRAELPASEGVSAIACTSEYLIVATDLLYVRIYSTGGFQHSVFSIAEPIICISAESNLAFLMYGQYVNNYIQKISFSVFDLENQKDIFIGNRSLPLSSPESPSNNIKIRSLSRAGDPVSVIWAGFIEQLSIPAFMDSCGIVRALFSEYGWKWVPILDSYQQLLKSLPDLTTTCVKINIFPISLNEESMLVALTKGDDPWPTVFPRPPLKELIISPPSPLGRLDLEVEKKFVYNNFII